MHFSWFLILCLFHWFQFVLCSSMLSDYFSLILDVIFLYLDVFQFGSWLYLVQLIISLFVHFVGFNISGVHVFLECLFSIVTITICSSHMTLVFKLQQTNIGWRSFHITPNFFISCCCTCKHLSSSFLISYIVTIPFITCRLSVWLLWWILSVPASSLKYLLLFLVVVCDLLIWARFQWSWIIGISDYLSELLSLMVHGS